jgi:type IV pilus assembly protein PilC
LPLTQALGLAKPLIKNNIYQTAIAGISQGINSGQPFYKMLQAQEIFPMILIQMVQVGEESGRLDLLLNKAANALEDELDQKISVLKELIEPITMTLIGLMVGGLVIALYLPIFDLGGII